jgi:hypothetical protein
MYLLPRASAQQRDVVDALKTHNVVIDSVAGSGKTTLNLHIASEFNCKILLLTYNRRLRQETSEKAAILGLDRLEVHTYHSFCMSKFGTGKDDMEMTELVEKMKDHPVEPYDMIILDEAQDMTFLYFEVVCMVCRSRPIICVLGDRCQSIYDFNEADSRFISLPVYPPNGREWKRCSLTYSFRITRPMADFINGCMIPRIQSHKKGAKPRYIVTNCYSTRRILEEFQHYVGMGYEYEDIFVLAASVRKSATGRETPVRRFANALTDQGVPIYIPGDQVRINHALMANKVVFTTFHQAKGLERKVVIVMGFDDSFFRFYKKDKNPLVCPNELYVATTRAREQLTLIHNSSNDYLPFLNVARLEDLTYLEGHRKSSKSSKKRKSKDKPVAVTDLVKHLPARVIRQCLSYITTKVVRPARDPIGIACQVDQSGGTESVSEITGLAIPAWFEYKLRGTMTILDQLIEYESKRGSYWVHPPPAVTGKSSDSDEDSDSDMSDEFMRPESAESLSPDTMTPEQLLYTACMYDAHASGYKFKAAQIDNYKWLSEKDLRRCTHRLGRLDIAPTAEFEKAIRRDVQVGWMPDPITIVGRVDCYDGRMFEFKCVQKFDTAHILQLAVYLWLANALPVADAMLYNVMTDEGIQVVATHEDLTKLVETIVMYRNYGQIVVPDSEFIRKAGAVAARHVESN